MYRVLIVDDEPIILSGIKHMVDWENIGCEIEGFCRNGEEALREIEQKHPDIVITDIKMPVMDGLKLLKICYESYPDIVFIILSSIEDFKFAQEAIKYNISDYLLKTELDEKSLSAAIEKAKSRSNKSKREDSEKLNIAPTEKNSVNEIISNILKLRNIEPEIKTFLNKNGLLNSYAFISFLFQYPAPTLEMTWSKDDYINLYQWEKEVIEKILPPLFPASIEVKANIGKYSRYIYFIYNINESTLNATVSRIESKVKTASKMVTGLDVETKATKAYSGMDRLEKAREEIESIWLRDYLEKDDSAPLHLEELDVDHIFSLLEWEIKQKNALGIKSTFAQLINKEKITDHGLGSTTMMLSCLESAIKSALAELGIPVNSTFEFIFTRLPFIAKRKTTLLHLNDLQNELISLLNTLSDGNSGSIIVEKALDYVKQHIQERILLTDVAEYACVSAGYLSKTFKKVTGNNLVDHISQMKVEKAKEMMKTGMTKINEIAIALGFENIYYFSKVFKKVTGLSPTEYLKMEKNDNET